MANHIRAVALFLLLLVLPHTARSQRTWFAAVGGGVSVPTSNADMNTGWLTEAMAGVILPGNIVSLRLGATLGHNAMKPSTGNAMMPGAAGEIDRSLGLMAGIMVMPDLDRDLIPYIVAGAGMMNGKYKGSDPGFAWANGLGVRLLTDLAEFYVEGRYVHSGGDSGHGTMVPITAGIRYSP